MSTTLTVNGDELLAKLAAKLDSVTGPAQIALAAIDAVNAVALRAQDSLLAGENADIFLSNAYVRGKTSLALATSKPRAEILTVGDTTIMGRFPLTHIRKAASFRAKGDPKRGIPSGSKAAGVKVGIKRSKPVYESKWFTMTLRKGNEPGTDVGVFVRTTSGKLKHIYGPSPYSLFRHQIGQQSDKILDDLQRTALKGVGDLVDQAVAP